MSSQMTALSLGGDGGDEPLPATLQNILDHPTLKWIFVGGKGGVGKTTCSSSIAVLLASVRPSVLIISTDPAHNLSDAFEQKFSKTPMLVNGFTNLFAMEVDPTVEVADPELLGESGMPGASMIQELMSSVPGIDEAMSFAEVMKQVQTMEYSVIIFDTAPTGHTLRLLSFPSLLERGLGKLVELKARFGGMFSQLGSMMGGGNMPSAEELGEKLNATKAVIEEVNRQFTNPELTTFVCVCIPEFLSLYETERLIQELVRFKIDATNIIVNQLLFPVPGSQCRLCKSRSAMQTKYLDQITDLYEDFYVVKLPLLFDEVRGVPRLREFAANLVTPFTGFPPDAEQPAC